MLVDADDDLGADIEAAIREASGDAPAPPEPALAAPEPPKPDAEAPDGRARDEQGKFVAKAPEPEQTQQASPDAPAAPPIPETSRPPHTLKATLKAKWATLDPEVRQEFERVEGEVQTAKSEWASKGERLNKFDALFAPHREQFALAGIDEFAAAQQLLAAHEFLKRDPNGAIAHLARQYGAQPQAFQQQTPNLAPEQQQVAELQRQVAEMQAERQREAQEREQTAKSEAAAEWHRFRDDPANPYAVNVQEHMHALLSGGRAATLKDAYDQAVWANPETRALLQTQVAAPAPVKDAKPAGLGVTGGPGTVRRPVSDVNPESSLEDDIREAYRSLGGRA